MIAALQSLVVALDGRARAALLLVALAQALIRVGVAFSLEGLVRGTRGALVLGVATGAAWAILAAVRTALRHRVRVRMLHASAAALLYGEVSDAPREGETPHAVLAAVFEAERVLADSLPTLVAEGLAGAVLMGVAATRVPGAFMLLLAASAALALGMVVVARRLLVKAQDAANLAHRAVLARWLEAKDGTLELAAAALEEVHLARIDEASTRWLRATARVELGASLLGRGPMAALALALGALAWTRLGRGDGGLAMAAFLAAASAPLAGFAAAAGEVSRGLGRAEPLVHRLAAPARVEAAHLGVSPSDLLDGRNLCVGYGGRDVLSEVSIRWARGVPLVPEGPNGSGKTTLLRTLAGLRAPRAGSLGWGGSRGPRASRLPVAFLPQRAHLASEGTVRDAVRMLAPHATDGEIHRALARVELSERLGTDGLDALVGTLSVGQRQRLALARVLLVDAELVVLDEPDANLDRQGRALIDSLVQGLARDRFVALVAHGDLRRPEGADVIAVGGEARPRINA